MPYLFLALFGLFILYLVVYTAVKFAINDSEAVRLLTEIKVQLMDAQNDRDR